MLTQFRFASLSLLAILLVPAAPAAPQSASGRDVRIATEVRHELLLLPRYSLYDWIEFDVQPGGNVVLRGHVVGPTLRADAEDAVKRIDGVTGVLNHIEALPTSAQDDQIRRAAYRAIYAEDGPLFHYAIDVVPSIHIVVENGQLTLYGAVNSSADSDFANLRARGVSGVQAVSNALTIAHPGLSDRH